MRNLVTILLLLVIVTGCKSRPERQVKPQIKPLSNELSVVDSNGRSIGTIIYDSNKKLWALEQKDFADSAHVDTLHSRIKR